MNRLIVGILVSALTIFSGCHSHESHDDHDHEAHNHASHSAHDEADNHGHEDGDGEEAHDPDEIILTPEKAKAAGVTVETVEPSSFSAVIKSSGRILTASGDEQTVVAPAAGIVSMKRGFTNGMAVGKGASLLSISSSRLPEGDLARRNELAYNQAKSDFERAEKLKEDNLITEKEYLAAKTEYERTRLAYEATGGKAAVGGVYVAAPIGGYVKECLVTDGEYVDVGQPLMRLTQNRKLYLRAEVAERDYEKLGAVESANFRPAYCEKLYSLKDLDGRKVASGQMADGNSPFIPVTFEFNNTGGIVPGSYAEVYLLLGRRENVITVPLSALTEEQGLHFVYVRIDEEGYKKKEVSLGASDGERVEILTGVEPGEQLVTNGAIHVKLASASSAIPAHSHNH